EIAARTQGKVILAGTTAGTIRAGEVNQSGSGTDFTILEGAHRCRAQLPVPGLHMVQNALLAIAAGRVFGLSLEECAAGLVAAAPGDLILIKGSRLARTEQVIEAFRNPQSIVANSP